MAVISRFQNSRVDIKVYCDDTTLELTVAVFISTSPINVRMTITQGDRTWTFVNPPDTNQTVDIDRGFFCAWDEEGDISMNGITINVRGEMP